MPTRLGGVIGLISGKTAESLMHRVHFQAEAAAAILHGSHASTVEPGKLARPAIPQRLHRCTLCGTRTPGDERQFWPPSTQLPPCSHSQPG